MTAADNFFQPNRLKLILAVTILVPVFLVILLVLNFPDIDFIVLAAITLVISYLAACIIDTLIESRTVKIAIASIAALVTILLGYIIVESMTMVCDPVHDPGIVCDPVHVPDTTPAPTVIATAQPTAPTPIVYDPVHEPGSCGPDACAVVPGIATGIVAQKLDECKKKCEQQ